MSSCQVPQPEAVHGDRGAAAVRAVVARVPGRGADDREHHDQDGRDGAQALRRQQMVSWTSCVCAFISSNPVTLFLALHLAKNVNYLIHSLT